MLQNPVKAKLRAGETVAGPIIAEARSIGTVKLMAREGFDFLFLDMEHALYDWETILTLVQSALVMDIVPIVRVTDLSYQLVARALDTGARGVIIPRVETAAQVADAVSFAKYPPEGRRGAGGDGRMGYERLTAAQVVEISNAETMVIVQVETQAGVDNLEEMASVPGLDVICVGPQDLSISLGVTGDFSHPTFVAAMERVASVCASHGVASGMVERDAADLKRWHDLGMRFLCSGTDAHFLARGAAESVATIQTFAVRSS